MTKRDDTAKGRRSRAQRGGRFTHDPELAAIRWDDGGAEALAEWMRPSDTRPPPAETLAERIGIMEDVANECLADPGQPVGGPTRHWARELLDQATAWRKLASTPDAAWREPGRQDAAFRMGVAWALLCVYARDGAAQHKVGSAGTAGKGEKAAAEMAGLRAAMAELNPPWMWNAPAVLAALLAEGWKSPWSERVTLDKIRAVLREPARGRVANLHVPAGKV